jgi:hypothetical protein
MSRRANGPPLVFHLSTMSAVASRLVATTLVARVNEVHFFLNPIGFALIFVIYGDQGEPLRHIDALKAAKSQRHAVAVANAVLDAIQRCADHRPTLFCNGIRATRADVSAQLTRCADLVAPIGRYVAA